MSLNMCFIKDIAVLYTFLYVQRKWVMLQRLPTVLCIEWHNIPVPFNICFCDILKIEQGCFQYYWVPHIGFHGVLNLWVGYPWSGNLQCNLCQKLDEGFISLMQSCFLISYTKYATTWEILFHTKKCNTLKTHSGSLKCNEPHKEASDDAVWWWSSKGHQRYFVPF